MSRWLDIDIASAPEGECEETREEGPHGGEELEGGFFTCAGEEAVAPEDHRAFEQERDDSQPDAEVPTVPV